MSEGKGTRIAWAGVLTGLAGSLLGVYLGLPAARLAFQGAALGIAILWFLRVRSSRLAGATPREGVAWPSQPASGLESLYHWSPLRYIGYPLWALIAILLLTTFTSTEIAASLSETFQVLAYLTLLALTCALPLHDLVLRRFLHIFLLLGLLAMLAGIYLYWGGSPDMHGAFGNKNHFAGYLLLLLPLALAAYLQARDRRESLAYGATATLLASGLLLSQSRGAWIALLPGLALLLWQERQKRGIWPRLGLLAGLTVLLALLINQAALHSTFSVGAHAMRDIAAATVGQEPPGTLGPRLDYWQGAIGIAADHPLLGTGPGTFGNIFPRYQRNPVYYSKYAHEVLLQTLAETGLLGLMVLLWLLLSFTFQVSRFAFARHEICRERHLLTTGLAAGLLSSFAHNLVELDWYVPAITILAVIEGGLLLALAARPAKLDENAHAKTPGRQDFLRVLVVIFNLVPHAFRAKRRVKTWGVGRTCQSAPTGSRLASLRHIFRQGAWGVALVLCVAGLIWAGLRAMEYRQLDLGAQAQDRGDVAVALADYQAASRWNPLAVAPQKALAGLALAAPARSPEQLAGLAAAQRAVTLAGGDPEAHYLLARHYQQRGDPGDGERALQELEIAASLRHPMQAPYIFDELGRTYLAADRLAEARDLYRRVVDDYAGTIPGPEEAPFLSQAHLFLGNIAARQGNPAEAIGEYRAAVSLNPSNLAALFNLGVLYYEGGEVSLALPVLEQAATQAPDQALFHYYLGLAYARSGAIQQARAQWEAALRLEPGCQPCKEEINRLPGP